MSSSNNLIESPDYLHFKHKYGFLKNFTELYRAFFWACQQREIDINHERCDKFFMKYIDNMGLKVRFDQTIIDPRLFTITIKPTKGGTTAIYNHINAGRIYQHQPFFIPLITIQGLTHCSLEIDGVVFTLELEDIH